MQEVVGPVTGARCRGRSRPARRHRLRGQCFGCAHDLTPRPSRGRGWGNVGRGLCGGAGPAWRPLRAERSGPDATRQPGRFPGRLHPGRAHEHKTAHERGRRWWWGTAGPPVGVSCEDAGCCPRDAASWSRYARPVRESPPSTPENTSPRAALREAISHHRVRC